MKFRALNKNQLPLAAIVIGAIVIAIPVSIFGIVGVSWRAFTSWTRLNMLSRETETGRGH